MKKSARGAQRSIISELSESAVSGAKSAVKYTVVNESDERRLRIELSE